MMISRRDVLAGGVAAGLAGLAGLPSWAKGLRRATFSSSEADVILKLTATRKPMDPGLGASSTFWCYQGELLKGPQSSLSEFKNSYLGPTIQVHTGDRVKIIFENNLPEPSIVHWHGLDVSHENDGHPHSAIETGARYEYDFVVENRAGMYWYHPHPHGRTGYQVYHGLAGLFIVRDSEEAALNLPDRDQELCLVVQDRYFNENNLLEYRPSMMGAFGNRLLINGQLDRRQKVRRGLYRLRLHNGCNARIFKLALSHGKQLLQIGSDGGLLDKPHSMDSCFFAPAERLDVLVDFRSHSPGEVIQLVSLPLVEGRGEKFTVAEFEVTESVGESYQVPEVLARFERISEDEASNKGHAKIFELIPQRGVGWTINGFGYEPDRYEDYELIAFGSTEVWEFFNPTGMPHPMHIHGTQFQVLKRQVGDFPGSLDQGWKDTVLVMPGDRVQVIKRFNTFKGTFLYHCHNLEHEDMSMMRNYKIVD